MRFSRNLLNFEDYFRVLYLKPCLVQCVVKYYGSPEQGLAMPLTTHCLFKARPGVLQQSLATLQCKDIVRISTGQCLSCRSSDLGLTFRTHPCRPGQDHSILHC